MSSTIKLSELAPGTPATISALLCEDSCASRLKELGFYPGAKTVCLFSSVLGDPRAYSVQGGVIALRNGESERIRVLPAL